MTVTGSSSDVGEWIGVDAARSPARVRDGDRPTQLERALQVLRTFYPQGIALRHADIAQRAGLPKSTTHRLVMEMWRLGVLERQGDRYTVGNIMFELGELAPLRSSLREVALPYLQDLHAATRGTVHLAVASGHDVLLVDRVRGHHMPSMPAPVGGRLPVTACGLGKALLTFGDPRLLREVEGRPFRRLTSRSVGDVATLHDHVNVTRERGYALAMEEAARGLACVAAPVLRHGVAVAAVSVSVPTPREPSSVMALAAEVRGAASALSRWLP